MFSSSKQDKESSSLQNQSSKDIEGLMLEFSNKLAGSMERLSNSAGECVSSSRGDYMTFIKCFDPIQDKVKKADNLATRAAMFSTLYMDDCVNNQRKSNNECVTSVRSQLDTIVKDFEKVLR